MGTRSKYHGVVDGNCTVRHLPVAQVSWACHVYLEPATYTRRERRHAQAILRKAGKSPIKYPKHLAGTLALANNQPLHGGTRLFQRKHDWREQCTTFSDVVKKFQRKATSSSSRSTGSANHRSPSLLGRTLDRLLTLIRS